MLFGAVINHTIAMCIRLPYVIKVTNVNKTKHQTPTLKYVEKDSKDSKIINV